MNTSKPLSVTIKAYGFRTKYSGGPSASSRSLYVSPSTSVEMLWYSS